MIKHSTSLLAVIVSCLNACTSWQLQSVSPQQVLNDNPAKEVRVTRIDGMMLVLRRPRIAGDTIYGAMGSRSASIPTALNAVALADVAHVAVRKGDAGRTTLMVLGSGALIAGLGFVT